MFLGIFAGVLTAVLKSSSYVFSARFMAGKRSSLKLVVFSSWLWGVLSALTRGCFVFGF